MDEVEDDLALRVPVAMALPHSAEGLAREPRRNEVGPHVLCPLGPKLNWVAPCGAGTGGGMGRVVWLGSLAVNVASPNGGGTKGLGCYCEASYSACQVSMCPGPVRFLGVPRPPDEARRGHADFNYCRAVTYVELVGSLPLGQDRSGLRTDVGLALFKVPEEVAFPRDDKSRWHAPPGGYSWERVQSPTAHGGPGEDEDNPSFSEDGETGGVIGVRPPGGQSNGGPGV